MVGSAVLRRLTSAGYFNVFVAHRGNVDLTRQEESEDWFHDEKFDIVVDCAAKVGGIHANNEYRADFIYENLQIQNNLIHSSFKTGVKKLLFLGSVCIYPKFVDQPIKEEYPASESVSSRVISIPMHPYLREDEQERVVAALLVGGA